MTEIAWFFQTHGPHALLHHVGPALLLGFFLYQSNYLQIFVRTLAKRAKAPIPSFPDGCPGAMLVLPTLLRKESELVGLQRAIRSAAGNGYPGPLVVCAAIDHAGGSPGLVERLEAWVRRLHLPRDTEVLVIPTAAHVGKAMAIETAVRVMRRQVDAGRRRRMPPLFFSMDADSEVTPGSLARIAARLTVPGRSRQCPLIVPANLGVRPSHYWKGWRHFFTVAGQLSLQVAREFTVTCSLNRHNSFRLLPVIGVSGALYGTWTELYEQAPRYGAFVKSLRVRDWIAWWLGRPPPRFASFTATCPEATIGPGDDTWLAWLAISARWSHGRVDLELPRTPWHALARAIRAYLVRAVMFEPEARVFTSTPTTIAGLFKQRIRWNSSRVWLIGRFGASLLYNWQLGAIVFLDVALVLVLGGTFVYFLLLLPIEGPHRDWLPFALLGSVAVFTVRSAATILGMLQERELPRRWHKLLALPLSGTYILVFNISTTILGYFHDLFLFGLNTGFAPEETLARSGTGRLALAYRARRALLLAVRAARHGDVPPGAFWLGWGRTRWTPGGYDGWTNRARRSPPVLPRATTARAGRGRRETAPGSTRHHPKMSG